MAYGSLDGLTHGSPAILRGARHGMLDLTPAWLGRVIDPLGAPLDGKGLLLGDGMPRSTRTLAPDATARARVGPRLDLGVRFRASHVRVDLHEHDFRKRQSARTAEFAGDEFRNQRFRTLPSTSKLEHVYAFVVCLDDGGQRPPLPQRSDIP